MSNAGAPDSSIVERLKKLLTKNGTELLKPCDPTEDLLRKLDRLEYVLLHTLQEHKKFVEMFLQPSKEALIADEFIRHSEFDVRVSADSYISQIIRITAPDEPYEKGHMKEFFLPANSIFEIVSCMSGQAYSKAVSILPTMSNTGSCVIMLDVEIYATVGHVFRLLFLDGIRFYRGKILCFDDKYKLHQIDYDDGEMEFLDLRRECWKLLKDEICLLISRRLVQLLLVLLEQSNLLFDGPGIIILLMSRISLTRHASSFCSTFSADWQTIQLTLEDSSRQHIFILGRNQCLFQKINIL